MDVPTAQKAEKPMFSTKSEKLATAKTCEPQSISGK
jgi:hypothetical protein